MKKNSMCAATTSGRRTRGGVAYLQMNETSVPEYPIEDWIPTHRDGRSPALSAAR